MPGSGVLPPKDASVCLGSQRGPETPQLLSVSLCPQTVGQDVYPPPPWAASPQRRGGGGGGGWGMFLPLEFALLPPAPALPGSPRSLDLGFSGFTSGKGGNPDPHPHCLSARRETAPQDLACPLPRPLRKLRQNGGAPFQGRQPGRVAWAPPHAGTRADTRLHGDTQTRTWAPRGSAPSGTCHR